MEIDLSKLVEIELVGENIKKYSDLGYLIPRRKNKYGPDTIPRGTKIFVFAKDLSLSLSCRNSMYYECDNCKKEILSMTWQRCFKFKSELKGIYCRSCSHLLGGAEHARLAKLKNANFRDLCINDNRQDLLDRWDYELNKYKPEEIGPTSGIEIYLKCPKNIHKSEYKSIKDIKYKDNLMLECKQCNSLENNFPNSIVLWSIKNNDSPKDYDQYSGFKVWWKCENGIHEDYKRQIKNSSILSFRCPECSQIRKESFLQEKVRLYLNSFDDIQIFHEQNTMIKCFNENTDRLLPYDNEIIGKDFKLIIEVNGRQHYGLEAWHKSLAKLHDTTPEEELVYQQWKDEYKKQYALSQGYLYLEISYITQKDDSWKTLIDELLGKYLRVVKH